MKKVIVTLDINYPKEITELTFPYMQKYADNIDADFVVLKDRKFTNLPITMEKFQLYELSNYYDWVIFLDADTIVNPNAVDFTSVIDYNTILVSEYLWPIGQFKVDEEIFEGKFDIHTPFYFLCFPSILKDVISLPSNPLDFVKYVNTTESMVTAGKDPSWHLDEFILNYNIIRYGLSTVSLKDDISGNKIATNGNYLSVVEKVKFLTENINILKNQINILGQYS